MSRSPLAPRTATAPDPSDAAPRRRLRDPVNTLSHGAGALAAVLASVVLLRLADGDPLKVAAFSVFCATMLFQYLSSTALHGLERRKGRYRWLKRIDHVAIYLFIAGSSSPLCLLTPDRLHGLQALVALWGPAWFGVLFKLLLLDVPRWLSVAVYHATVWLSFATVLPFLDSLPPGALFWLILGVAWYLLGSIVYAAGRPNPLPGFIEHHELLHFFVLAGSVCHFITMLHYVS